jgi:predicted CXXCH cytochrome family protein
MCSYCHIPHVSKGDRLWPSAGFDSANKAGLVGILCASCHADQGSSYNNSNSPGSANLEVRRAGDVYNTDLVNHILIDDGVYANNTNQNYYGGATQFGEVNRWPYCSTQGTTTVAQKIECSSCHNPHSQDFGASTKTVETDGDYRYGNDFLRAAMYNTTTGVAFCEYCHEEKARGGNALNTIGTGTHPVGTTANADLAGQEDIHIESSERVNAGLTGASIVSSILYDMGIGTGIAGTDTLRTDHGPGQHLTSYDTGGVTCQTCHRVHGAPRGTGNAWQRSETGTTGSYLAASRRYLAASDDGDCNILAVENDSNGGTVNNIGASNWSYPTGKYAPAIRFASDYNDLCIDCHETTPSVGKNWKLNDNNAIRGTADLVNDAHPVNIAPDGVSESGFDLTVQDPGWSGKNSNWTNARWAGTNGAKGDDSLTSGNGRYKGGSTAPTNSRTEIVCLTCHAVHDGEPGTPILRSKTKDFCSDCHTLSLGLVSHPVGYGSAMQDNPDAAIWPNGDNLPLSDYYTGTNSSKSFNRVKSNTIDMACFTCHAAHDGMDGFMLRVTDDNSRICTGCHTDIVLVPGMENPSNYIAEYNDNDFGYGDRPDIINTTSSATNRLGSHYTGTVTNTDNIVGEIRWAFTGAWTDTDTDGGTGPVKAQTSHWNGGNPLYTQNDKRMQCQSCHTPHDAASGLVEANSYDGSTTNVDWDFPSAIIGNDYNYDPSLYPNTTTKMAFTPTSALLLGSNVDSKMCATCHWPRGTHVTTIYTVPAKPDPNRTGGVARRRRDFCTRIEAYVIQVLNGEQEYQYNVYDLIADGTVTAAPGGTNDAVRTPESPCNFPPLRPGQWDLAAPAVGKMLCDSCHAPHGAATRAGAFILEAGSGDASTLALANQRIAKRNYQALCWRCHDK